MTRDELEQISYEALAKFGKDLVLIPSLEKIDLKFYQ